MIVGNKCILFIYVEKINIRNHSYTLFELDSESIIKSINSFPKS
jgi:hypothetical protein